MNTILSFASLGGLGLWGDSWGGFLDQDKNMPYVYKYADNQFYYFTKQDNLFVLQMTSKKDLNQKEK